MESKEKQSVIMSNKGRYVGRVDSNNRPPAPLHNNYPHGMNIVQNSHYSGNNNIIRSSSNNLNNGRAPGYSKGNNYVVTHRVEQQYSKQVIDPAKQLDHHRQPVQAANNMSAVPPVPQQPLHPNHNVEAVPPPDSLAVAIVPYKGGSTKSPNNSTIHTLSTSSPTCSSPTHSDLDEEGDESIPELDSGGHHYKKLGEILSVIFLKSNKCAATLQAAKKRNRTLKEENKVMQTQLVTLRQEKDNQIKNNEEQIVKEQKEATNARKECYAWRNQAMRSIDQVDNLNVQLSGRDNKIGLLDVQVANLQKENADHVHFIRQMQQKERIYLADIDGKGEAIEQNKQEIRKKIDELANADSMYKEKLKELKKLEDDTSAREKELNRQINEERQRVQVLEDNVKDRKSKYKSLLGTADKLNSDKQKLESENKKLLHRIVKQCKYIERKDLEILRLTDERNSLQVKKQAIDEMMKEQSKKLEAFKDEIDGLKVMNARLSSDLEKEMELKNRILAEQMEIYTKPTLLNKLLQEKMQTMPVAPFVVSVVTQQEQVECSVTLEEAPSSSVEQDGISGSTTSTNGDRHETDFGRKRKHTAGSANEGRLKDPRRSRGIVSSTERCDDETGDNGEHATHNSKGSVNFCRVSNNANSNADIQTSRERYFNKRSSGNGRSGDKERRSESHETSTRVRILNPNINFKKS